MVLVIKNSCFFIFGVKHDTEQLVINSSERDEKALDILGKEMEKEVSETSVLKKKLKKEEILQRINDTVSLAYESALNSGLQTVKAALSKSTFDGDKKKHSEVMDKLNDKAQEIWRRNIVKKIENNENK